MARRTKLSPRIRTILLGKFVNDLGRGFTLPFSSIYFSEEVGLSMTAVGIGLALFSGMGILAAFYGGYVSDRFGRKHALLASMLGSGIVYFLFPGIRSEGAYWLLSALAGGFLSLYWPGCLAALTDLTEPGDRPYVFALLRVLVNAALGLGALMAGFAVHRLGGVYVERAAAFRMLFYIDSATYLAFFAILWLFVEETLPADASRAYRGFRRGWGEALRSPNVLFLAGLMCFFTALYSNYQAFPVFFQRSVRLSEWEIGLLFTLNTAMIVVLQLPTGSILENWRRTRALILSAGFFATGLLGLALSATDPFTGFPMAAVAIVFYTLGEMIHGPAADALYGSLAPMHLRGTYMSVSSITWSLGMGLAPILCGIFLDAGLPRLLWLVFAGALVLASWGLLRLEKRLADEVNRAR